MTDTLKSITEWHQLARPKPDHYALTVQLGCHVEEFVEMLDALDAEKHLLEESTMHDLRSLARHLKERMAIVAPLNEASKIELLDSLADQVVTAAGVAHCAGMDFQGGLAEVNRSNWSKFENGQPVFQPGGKIAKGQFYTPPDLKDFV